MSAKKQQNVSQYPSNNALELEQSTNSFVGSSNTNHYNTFTEAEFTVLLGFCNTSKVIPVVGSNINLVFFVTEVALHQVHPLETFS